MLKVTRLVQQSRGTPIRNATADTLRVLPGELIGSVDRIEVEEDAVVKSAPTSHGEGDKVYVATVVSQVEDGKH